MRKKRKKNWLKGPKKGLGQRPKLSAGAIRKPAQRAAPSSYCKTLAFLQQFPFSELCTQIGPKRLDFEQKVLESQYKDWLLAGQPWHLQFHELLLVNCSFYLFTVAMLVNTFFGRSWNPGIRTDSIIIYSLGDDK